MCHMEAATSTLQHSYGLSSPRDPNPPHGAQQAQGSSQPPPRTSRPEEQHHKPFFYIQPSQPYVPMQSLQWPVPMPMPVSYNPFFGYPGLGYGVPMMSHYQPNQYIEPPGFVVPHTHLHLMDYRRMLNPQYYQTMAYHSRKFRYQHNGPAREMTSSQVQTEPLSAAQRTSTPGSNDTEASSGLPVCSSVAPTVPTTQSPASSSVVQKGDHSLELKDMASSSTTRTPTNGSFVIQTEEVRIECCTTPVGLQLLHSHETAEVSHRFSQDVVQCSSVLQGSVLQEDGLCLPANQSEQALQARPDILLIGTPNSDEKNAALEESKTQMDPVTEVSNLGCEAAAHGDVEETRNEKDLSVSTKNSHLKVVHLPFDPKYLDELRRMESTVWSVEETLIASPESLIQNGCTDSYDETLAAVTEESSADVSTVKEETPAEEVLPMIEMPPLEDDELEDEDPTVNAPMVEMVLDAMMDVVEETPMSKWTHTAQVGLTHNLSLLDNTPVQGDGNQQGRETVVQDHQDTSFESLPAYLPSASWLADFDHAYYCSKMPPPPKKQGRPLSRSGLDVPSRRRKLDLEYKDQPTVRKPKERYKPKSKVDRRSLSDHECCLSRNFNENLFIPSASKRERLCSRCLAKHRVGPSASPGIDGRSLKRKAVPFQQRNDALLPTCEACKSHTKKLVRKGSSPDIRGLRHGRDSEGESSENSSCRRGPKWRAADDSRVPADTKRPLASKQNQQKCPAAMYPKLREKNCVCNELQHHTVAWERLHHCPHGNTIREMDENCAMPASPQEKWINVDQVYLTHRWQTVGSHPTEKSWKVVMPNPDGDCSKNETRSHFNKHKKSQSQGTYRKDTRC
ncbi:hypothetical protein INR49_012137 [Caranx melampygus]|nr:hypothetical protein INR49_012137 [Caranx melampygus]